MKFELNTWQTFAAAENNQWQDVCYSPELDLYVAISTNGTHQVMTSPDGYVWTAESTPVSGSNYSICWSPENSLFVIVGTKIFTSPNGTTWIERTLSTPFALRSVIWIKELSLFLAVGRTYTSGSAYAETAYSSNGITWTAGMSNNSGRMWDSVCWSPELSKLVAVSSGNMVGLSLMTSSDGISWIISSSGVGNGSWYSVAWSPILSRFVAIGNSYIDHYPFAISSNGSSWSSFADADVPNYPEEILGKIIWSNTLGKFFVFSTGFTEPTTKFFTSSNGSSWDVATFPDGKYYCACEGRGKMIAVSSNNYSGYAGENLVALNDFIYTPQLIMTGR